MNLTLKEVVQTSAEGDKFSKVAETYVRGNYVCGGDWRASGCGWESHWGHWFT